MVWLLIVAAMISGILGDWLDAVAILGIVALNIAISIFQELKPAGAGGSSKAFSANGEGDGDGSQFTIAARELVPGDIITLEAGI